MSVIAADDAGAAAPSRIAALGSRWTAYRVSKLQAGIEPACSFLAPTGAQKSLLRSPEGAMLVRRPQGRAVPPKCYRISAPPLAACGGRCAIPDPLRSTMTADVVLHHIRETTMPIEQHIEELRAELRNCCDVVERAQIEGELETALAEREAMLAASEAHYNSEPPF